MPLPWKGSGHPMQLSFLGSSGRLAVCSPVGRFDSAAGAGAEQETPEGEQQWTGHLAVWSVLQVSSVLAQATAAVKLLRTDWEDLSHLRRSFHKARFCHFQFPAVPLVVHQTRSAYGKSTGWTEGHTASALASLQWQLLPLLSLPHFASGASVQRTITSSLIGPRAAQLR